MASEIISEHLIKKNFPIGGCPNPPPPIAAAAYAYNLYSASQSEVSSYTTLQCYKLAIVHAEYNML